MLTDAILKEAAAEAERFRLSIVPEEEGPHEFSKRFQRKMEKLIRRAEHPIRYQVMRIAAAIAIAVATLFGAVMAISPEARAAVIGWIKETFGVYAQYSNEQTYGSNETDSGNNTPKSTKDEYHLAVIPEGYREISVIDKTDGKMYVYINELGEIIQFVYTYGAENSSLFVETEAYAQHSAFVNEWSADIYIAKKETETNVIIWQDPYTGVLFQISAMEDCAELIKIAETVAKIEA